MAYTPEDRTGELARKAIRDTKELIAEEARLATDDVRKTAVEAGGAALAFGVAAAAGIAGLELVVISFAQATRRHPSLALFVGLGLLGVAALAGSVGVDALPKKPLAETRARLAHDVEEARDAV
jgi:hypothetical protein